jgi:hypothetical protein
MTVSPQDFIAVTNPQGFTHTFNDETQEITRLVAYRMYGKLMALYNGLTAYVWVVAILLIAAVTGKPVHHYVVSNKSFISGVRM